MIVVSFITTEDTTTTITIVEITMPIVVVVVDMILVIPMEVIKIIKPVTVSMVLQKKLVKFSVERVDMIMKPELMCFNHPKRSCFTRTKRKAPKARLNIIKGIVNKMLARKIETKQSTYTTSDGTEISHNNFVVLETAGTFFSTNPGTVDPMNSTGTRIGDEITVKGLRGLVSLLNS
jgi:hypothetical protein